MPRKKRLPVPEENRSPKGPHGSESDAKLDNPVSEGFDNENIEQTGDRANVRQNTTNQQQRR